MWIDGSIILPTRCAFQKHFFKLNNKPSFIFMDFDMQKEHTSLHCFVTNGGIKKPGWNQAFNH